MTHTRVPQFKKLEVLDFDWCIPLRSWDDIPSKSKMSARTEWTQQYHNEPIETDTMNTCKATQPVEKELTDAQVILKQLRTGTYTLGDYLVKYNEYDSGVQIAQNPLRNRYSGSNIVLSEDNLVELSKVQCLVDAYYKAEDYTRSAKYTAMDLMEEGK